MHLSNRLQCPECRSAIGSTQGKYTCPVHGTVAEIADGILLLQPADAGYFEQHWQENEPGDIPAGKREAGRVFLAWLLDRTKSQPIVTCLDVGAGDGIHLSLLAESAPEIERAGLDISLPALQTAARQSPGSLLMLANAEAIPMQDDSVDASLSYGVLGYTDNPWHGLAEMVRVTKPGGLVGVWFYPPPRGLQGACFRAARATIPRLPGLIQRRMADLLVPFLSLLPTASGLGLHNATWAACREVVLVNIAAPQLKFPSANDIVANLENLGCNIIAQDEHHPIALWAQRKEG